MKIRLKKIARFVFSLIFLSTIACDIYGSTPSLADIEVKQECNYDFENNIEINHINDIFKYINKFKYEKDVSIWGIPDYWQTPEQTDSLKTGDCEDFSIFALHLAWTKLNINDVYAYRIETGRQIKHIIISINGIFYEAQTGQRIYGLNMESIIWEAHYTEMIWMAINYHDSVGKYF